MRQLKQRGILMVTVAVMLAIIGALAFAMSREGAMAAFAVDAAADATTAKYLAEAGLKQQMWSADQAGCSGYQNQSGPFPGGNFAATITPTNGKKVTVVSVGTPTLPNSTTPTGASSTVTRQNVTVHQTAMPVNPMPLAGTNKGDTYINGLNSGQAKQNYSGATSLYVSQASNTRALIKFDLHTIPVNSSIVKVTLQVNRTGINSLTSGPVSVHALTSDWDYNNVTWNTSGKGSGWTTPGGDFDPADASVAPTGNVGVAELAHVWELQPTIVDRWVNQAATYPNYGIILTDDTPNADFVFISNAGGQPPVLTVSFHPPCP